jgi:hypothetical protein
MSGRRSHAGISSASSRLVIAFNSLLRRDVPNALQTVVIAIHGGEIVGGYMGADKLSHGFLMSDGHVTTIDAPGGPTFTNVTNIDSRGEMVGRYTVNGVTHAYLSGENSTPVIIPATFTRGHRDQSAWRHCGRLPRRQQCVQRFSAVVRE